MFNRHDRIWLSAAGWEAARGQMPGHAEILAQWERNDWPAIVRRSEGATRQDSVCLGLPLPPDVQTGIKLRLPFIVAVADVARHATPLALSEATSALPSAWRESITDFAGTATRGQLVFHLYGSAAMQSMTSLSYLSASSDLDLLFSPRNREQLREGLQLLRMHARHLPLDGEIVFPSGRAVAWKEWAAMSDMPDGMRILTKSMHAVNLVDCAALRAELE
jgi:phosphoribosyl-dephospho-CoA transferase